MPLVSHARQEIHLKLVYYGPGLGGKTTNIERIHAQSVPDRRGKLVTASTESERTLFFDLLPVDLGRFRSYGVRLQLCTVPGQIAYDRTRRLVLQHVDGVVFVVDSQPARLHDNVASLENLYRNLRLQGDDPDRIPLIVQYNKRDIDEVMPVEELARLLGVPPHVPHIEAVATRSVGVFETVKLALKYCLRLVGDPAKAPEGRFRALLRGERRKNFPRPSAELVGEADLFPEPEPEPERALEAEVTELPDTELPDTGLPDTGLPDTGLPGEEGEGDFDGFEDLLEGGELEAQSQEQPIDEVEDVDESELVEEERAPSDEVLSLVSEVAELVEEEAAAEAELAASALVASVESLEEEEEDVAALVVQEVDEADLIVGEREPPPLAASRPRLSRPQPSRPQLSRPEASRPQLSRPEASRAWAAPPERPLPSAPTARPLPAIASRPPPMPPPSRALRDRLSRPGASRPSSHPIARERRGIESSEEGPQIILDGLGQIREVIGAESVFSVDEALEAERSEVEGLLDEVVEILDDLEEREDAAPASANAGSQLEAEQEEEVLRPTLERLLMGVDTSARPTVARKEHDEDEDDEEEFDVGPARDGEDDDEPELIFGDEGEEDEDDEGADREAEREIEEHARNARSGELSLDLDD